MDTIFDIPSTWHGHRDFAHWLVQRLNPQVTVDLGVDLGFSMFSLAEKNTGHVWGIDTFEGDDHEGHKQGTYEQCMAYKDALGLDNITVLKDTFEHVAETWRRPIDILHVDGFHTYEAVKSDFMLWAKFVKDDGVVLLHDTVSFFDVAKFFEEINLPKIMFRESAGLGVVCMDANFIQEIKDAFPHAIRREDIEDTILKIKQDADRARGGTIGSAMFKRAQTE